jgi:hypothetical protein
MLDGEEEKSNREHAGTELSFVRFVAAMGFVTLFVGCANTGSTWSHARTASDYQAPQKLKVSVVVQTQGEDLGNAVQELKSSLRSELKSRGIQATFADRADGSPMTELRVIEWTAGSRWKRYWRDDDGEGHIVVVVKSPSANGQPGFNGTVRGYVVAGAWYGGSAMISASEAGLAIAKAIAGEPE